MKQINLTKNKIALVDDEDFEWINQYKWHLHSGGYGATKINQRAILMHRFIIGTPEGLDTDHINRNKLDNRRSNLRVCTHAENMKNKNPYKVYTTNRSGSNGVSWNKRRKRWIVRIQIQKKRKYYGQYFTKLEALEVANLIKGVA